MIVVITAHLYKPLHFDQFQNLILRYKKIKGYTLWPMEHESHFVEGYSGTICLTEGTMLKKKIIPSSLSNSLQYTISTIWTSIAYCEKTPNQNVNNIPLLFAV